MLYPFINMIGFNKSSLFLSLAEKGTTQIFFTGYQKNKNPL